MKKPRLDASQRAAKGPAPSAGLEALAEGPPGCGPLLCGGGRDGRPLRQQIFDYVRGTGRAARADVTRALSISAGSVTTLTSELIALGLLREVQGAGRSEGRGRPPVALEVVPEGRLVVGIKLSDERHSAVLVDFAGTVLAEASLPTAPIRKTLAQTCDEAEGLVEELMQGRDRSALGAVGLGVAGPADHETGIVPWSPLLDGRDVPLKAAMEERLGVTVLVENDSNVLALAELWFGAGRALSDFVVVTIENGVGMGLVLGNRLWRGTRGMGLELGHMKVHLDGALCRCGKRGCLEAYVADYALAREAGIALGRSSRNLQSPLAMLEALYAEAKGGNETARTIFERAGRYLALGLSNVVQLYDPALIILSGERMRYDYLYAEEVLAEMASLGMPNSRPPCPVEIHAWGDMAWARGASALALSAVTEAALADRFEARA